MASEVFVILLLILINGIFSMAEIAIVSSRKSRLENDAQKGDRNAEVALSLANDPNKFLSTVQVGITTIGVITGAFGGASLSENLAVWIAQFEQLKPYSNGIALSVIVVSITFFSLVLGELVPKRIGMNFPEGIARVMAIPMNLISKLFLPFVWILSITTDLLLKLFQIKPSDEPSVTEEEIKSLVAQGTNMGIFEEVEQEIVDRVFTLSDRRVGSIMTNKLDIEWIDINDEFDNIKETVMQAPYSHFPVCNDSLDDVIGIVSTKQFLQTLLQNGTVDLQNIAEKPLFIPESMKAFRVLEQFQKSKNRIAMVVDEFGTIQGLVTLKDLFEAMVGELEPATDESYTIVEREDGTFLVDGLMSFEEFLQYFEMGDVDPEERAGFHTLGGLIFNIAHEIPKTGEKFEWNNLSFEIVDMDGNRIDKLLVRLLDKE
ncbi:hemolysin family protein [Xanthocytophaga agilis]|uniref:Hemolysin family protein n=1 Tax=Xanthocytophaga agilis TaxID=3048010 RepID=A0AAE3UF79_9BACT|nr:hemolysin family protein [Xanthocytophaga agilis]MDJ1501077.1 hemolysin family protein [Xanthocytophaga agilis]